MSWFLKKYLVEVRNLPLAVFFLVNRCMYCMLESFISPKEFKTVNRLILYLIYGILSFFDYIKVARLHQVSNSSRNKKLESIFVRRLFHASRPLRQHHDQGPPPPLQINLKHVGAVLTLIAVGGLNYYMYGRVSMF